MSCEELELNEKSVQLTMEDIQLLTEYSWDMAEYTSRFGYFYLSSDRENVKGLTKWQAEHIYQLTPIPPGMEDPLQDMENSRRIDKEKKKEIQKQNESVADAYLVRALQEKELRYLSFFLHGYEHKLNGKVYSFLRRNGMDTYDPALFLDMKLALQELILKKLPTFDPSRNAKFLTYLHHFIYDTFKTFRMQQECWQMKSLDTYKTTRRMAATYNANDQDKTKASMDYIGKQGINGVFWALIAFDSHDYETPTGDVTRDNLVKTILAAQTSDGGWSLSGTTGDADMTGMALQALAPYYNTDSAVKAAVDKALNWLSTIQNKDGSFSGSEGTTSESLAQVITGLTALGINPETDTRFIKNGVSVVDALSKFYVEGGGFIPTGIRVSGHISSNAELLVTEGCEHENCIVCKYLEKLPMSIVLSRYHIALTGGYYGLLYVQIPVDQAFEGKIVTIAYCDDGRLVTIQVEVRDGYASFFVDRLHTFVILDGQYHAVTEGGHQMLASDDTGETVYVDGLFNTVA